MGAQLHFKKYIFVKSTLFFDSKRLTHSGKSNAIFWQYVQNKGKFDQDT